MKQRIRVTGVIRGKGGVLLLKKKIGHGNGPIFWELPAGKIEYGEQPEEALSRVILEVLGIRVEEIILRDVVSFLGIGESGRTASLYIVYDVKLGEGERFELDARYSAYKYMHGEDYEQYLIGDGSRIVLGLIEDGAEKPGVRIEKGVANGATVYVDGCSRGNPGPAGIGYYIVSENGELLRRGGEFVGFASSRMAEYYALKEGVEQAQELGLRKVRFVGDNLMMINQMNGVYRVKNKDILLVYNDIQEMLRGFEAVSFMHVKREKNREADREANEAVDRHFRGD